ncbi:MarR family winged helix-turn-helix transcriptional regulator [Clostridium sp. FAM 1755]|uniref:MarR family winged helix-turn-helix transcriptional regulator n=1 Tax=Clostridium caseinilyticum TaxID=3350403 RepID=UPI0038F725F9
MIRNTTFMEQLNKYYAVWQEYNYAYEEWAKAHGISVNSLLVLSAIHEGDEDCTQKKISQRWLIPKQTINMVLKDFESKGYVELLPMQEDKRNKLIRFTAAGKEYADAIISKLRKVELFVVGEIGIERMQQLNESMALFVELFNKAGGKDEPEA